MKPHQACLKPNADFLEVISGDKNDPQSYRK